MRWKTSLDDARRALGTDGRLTKVTQLLTCLCVLAMVPIAPAGADAGSSGWVGKIVPAYPDGVTETSSTCIGDTGANPAAICDHAFVVLDDAQSKLRTILALEQMPHFGKQPLWRIVDAVEPEELGDRDIHVASGTCQRHAIADATVVALVQPAEREWLSPLRAWRFDIHAGKLIVIPVDGIRCHNEGFGYEG